MKWPAPNNSDMWSLANLIVGVVVAVAVVLVFGLLLGLVDDMRHEMQRPRRP
jgi:multisubunit Na+/H+ antiporter MnhE subunit